jgi:pyruvate dehydrogenase E1 component alpha subunit
MFRRVAALHGVKKTLPIEPQKPFKLWEGGKTNLPPLKTEITVDSDMLIDNFKQMVRIRRMEQLCDQSYKLKKIRGFCHLYIGQESIAVGMENVLTFDDPVVTSYRDHGWYVVRGGSPYDVFCEMFWKKDGCSKGKGGSMHMYNVKNNFYGGNGIVPHRCRLGLEALLHQRSGEPQERFGLSLW